MGFVGFVECIGFVEFVWFAEGVLGLECDVRGICVPLGLEL